MKKIIFVLMLAMIATFSVNAHKYRPAQISISIQTFYDELSPYGDWIYTPEYGYVWRPYFDRPESFRPYSSNGDWVYTDYGWTWVSDYRWGWAPFHYGRWYFEDYLGWLWIPGYEWAPAWVTWGSYSNYWGWAPLGPEVYVSVNFNWIAPDLWWTFVPCGNFYSHNWHDYIYDRPVHVTNITNITNIYVNDNDRNQNHWFRGPRVNDVERHSRTKVRRMEVVQSERSDNYRVENGRVNVYRPTVERGHDNYRPSETRSMENSRSANRIQQNPRSFDPGSNRTHDSKSEIRNERQTPGNRQAVEPRMQPQRNTPENGRNQENRNENPSRGTRNTVINSNEKSVQPGRSTTETGRQNEGINQNQKRSVLSDPRIGQTNARNQEPKKNTDISRKQGTGSNTANSNQRTVSEKKGNNRNSDVNNRREAKDKSSDQSAAKQRRR